MTLRLDLDQPVTLSPHAALKRRAEGEILVLPERAIRLGGSGPQILHLCDGARSGHDVVAAMRALYPNQPEIDLQIVEFLDQMWALGGVVVKMSEKPEPRC